MSDEKTNERLVSKCEIDDEFEYVEMFAIVTWRLNACFLGLRTALCPFSFLRSSYNSMSETLMNTQ